MDSSQQLSEEILINDALVCSGLQKLKQRDPVLNTILNQEARRQLSTLSLVASYSSALPEVLASTGSAINNITTEGYPGNRFHAGCILVDAVENLAIERAKTVFSAEYANVQPLSGSNANQAVMFALLKPGDTIMGLSLDAGGHLTHGAPVSFSGQFYRSVSYVLNTDYLLDYDAIRTLAKEHKPKLLICGASAYPRKIDFKKFREIADEIGAFLLADISHIAGLVAAGLHESPIDAAHVVTTSTYKQLYGPRGGLILSGKDAAMKLENNLTLAQAINKAVFPGVQSTPQPSIIAGKAAAFHFIATPEFKRIARNIISYAEYIACCFIDAGYKVVSHGTDNHMIMIDTMHSLDMTGYVAEKALESCGIIVNKNKVPGDVKSPFITSGIRLGTNDLALRNLSDKELIWLCNLLQEILRSVQVIDDKNYILDPEKITRYQQEIAAFCKEYPVSIYKDWMQYD